VPEVCSVGRLRCLLAADVLNRELSSRCLARALRRSASGAGFDSLNLTRCMMRGQLVARGSLHGRPEFVVRMWDEIADLPFTSDHECKRWRLHPTDRIGGPSALCTESTAHEQFMPYSQSARDRAKAALFSGSVALPGLSDLSARWMSLLTSEDVHKRFTAPRYLRCARISRAVNSPSRPAPYR
jgi:hypothetical protein